MKKLFLILFFLFPDNTLIGMNKDLYFLCNATQECCVCMDSVTDIHARKSKGSVLALPCCYTGDKAKREEVTIICNGCFNALKKYDRPATPEEEAATEAGEFKTNYCCPMCRGDLKKNKPVPLTDDNIVRGTQPKSSVAQPAVTKNDRLPHFRQLVFKHLKDDTLNAHDLLVHFPQFNRSDIDGIASEYALFRNSRILSLMVAGTFVCYGLALIKRMISNDEDLLGRLEKKALISHDSLLSLNFDLANPILPLANQCNIPMILKTVDDEQLQATLCKAVADFDTVLETVSTTITTRYYYHTTQHFLEKEQHLVAQFEEAYVKLQSSIRDYKKHKKPSHKGALFLKFSGATLVASVCGYYWLNASPLKRWGLFS